MKNVLCIILILFSGLHAFAQCSDVQSLTGSQTTQLNASFSALQTALYAKNLSQIDSISASAKVVFGTEAGQPETAESYVALSTNTTWLSLTPALNLSRQLIAADSVAYTQTWRMCKGELPPTYQPNSVPLRLGAEICIGLIRIANAETDLARKALYMQWAKQGLDTLLTMQLPSGAFPFPDVRPYGDPVFTPIINNYLQSLGADSVNVLANGWIIDDRGTGEFKFDAGVIGGAFAEAFLFTGDTNYRNVALRTAMYTDTLRLNTNYNYNTFQSYALSFGYRLDPSQSNWALNTDTILRYSCLPGQIPNGRWMDGHNARSVYHLIIIHNVAAAMNNIPVTNPNYDTLSNMLCMAVRSFIVQHDSCDASTGFDGLLRAWTLSTNVIPQQLHDSLGDLVGKYINLAAISGSFLDVYTMGLYLDALLNLSATEEQDVKRYMSISPNPATNEVTIEYSPLPGEEAIVELYDARGLLVYTSAPLPNSQSNSFRLPIGDLPDGIYIVVISTSAFRVTERMVKFSQ